MWALMWLLLAPRAALAQFTTDLGDACIYSDATGRCVPPLCPGSLAQRYLNNCWIADTDADGALICLDGCTLKQSAPGSFTNICALDGFDSGPVTAGAYDTVVECADLNDRDTPRCKEAYSTYLRDTGCVGACHDEFMWEDTRGQECTGSLDLDEATCTAIELSACPGAAAPPLNGPSRELPGASLAPMAAPGTEVEAVAAPSPLSGGTGDVDLTRCAFNPTNLGCFSERCPNDPLLHWETCVYSAQPPCPNGCAEKPVAGEAGVSICAVAGFGVDPIDGETARAFFACVSTPDFGADARCGQVIAEFASVTGCTGECVRASADDNPRNAPCIAIPTDSQALCEATTVSAPCPDYPPPPSGPAEALPPPAPTTAPSTAGSAPGALPVDQGATTPATGPPAAPNAGEGTAASGSRDLEAGLTTQAPSCADKAFVGALSVAGAALAAVAVL